MKEIKNTIYSILNNTDESLLLLNPVLKKHNFKLIKISMDEFEQQFGTLLCYDREKKYETEFEKRPPQPSFGYAIAESHFIDYNTISNNYVILLKNLCQDVVFLINGHYSPAPKEMQRSLDFLEKFITNLRLVKPGAIASSITFSINEKKQDIMIKTVSDMSVYGDVFKLDESDIPKCNFDDETLPNYIALSINSFASSYGNFHINLRYIMLITCLEALFNSSPGNINQTISRHTAVLLAKSKEEFDSIFVKTKKLYQERNIIVHGSSKIVSKETLNEAYEIIRQTINKSKALNIKEKKDLFNYLNSKGFE